MMIQSNVNKDVMTTIMAVAAIDNHLIVTMTMIATTVLRTLVTFAASMTAVVNILIAMPEAQNDIIVTATMVLLFLIATIQTEP